MLDVVAMGELLIDFTCMSTDEHGYPTMAAHPGGAPANFLAALSSFGAKTALIGKVGTDTFGRLLIGSLNKAGISSEGIVSDDSVFTTLAFVTLDEKGGREFAFARKPGADTQLTADELNYTLIDSASIFHFGTLSLTNEPARTATQKAVSYARQHGKLITFDPNLRKPLWNDLSEAKEQMLWGLSQADIVKISDDEIAFLFDTTPEKSAKIILNDYNVKLVFVTLGPDGCYFDNGIASGKTSAFDDGIVTIDTTGAGDIFGGSAIWKFLQLKKSPDALTYDELKAITTFASASAGISTSRPGGITSVPTLSEVEKALGV